MVDIKTKEEISIHKLEAELNNLWGELNTANISHTLRTELEEKLTFCEEQFKSVLNGEINCKEFKKKLDACDVILAKGSIQQAENEISRAEHDACCFQALKNVCKELDEGTIKPLQARHEVKKIMRHHH